MKPRTASRLAWSLWGLTTGATAASVVLSVVGGTRPGEGPFVVLLAIFQLAFSGVGALVASRHPRNPIGWVFLATGLLWSVSSLGTAIAILGLLGRIAVTDLVRFADWVGSWLFIPGIFLPVTFLFLLFPDGRLPSRRWRPLAWLAGTAVVLSALGEALGPFASGDAVLLRRNPYSLGSQAMWQAVENASWFLGFGSMIGSATALVIRLRRSRGEQRQQLKWLAYASLIVGLIFIVSSLGWVVFSDNEFVTTLVLPAILLSGLILIPIAAGTAILRHGLYEIDIVINKTVVYGLLAAFITALYVGLVVGVGALIGSRGNLFLSIMATAVIALLFQPARERARRFANRLVYGKRATPYEVLSAFGERLAESYAVDDVLPRLARVAGEGVGAGRSTVWVRVGREVRVGARWPAGGDDPSSIPLPGEDLPALDEDRAFEVRHRGHLLGAISVAMPPRESLSPTGEKLLRDLAAQAGLILRNVGLIEELRASRQRIVAAQDQERRRLERNIHDGAQQQLVALAVNLKLARTLSARDPDRAGEVLDRLQTEAQEAMENLRDLARGIYPPLLADKGLAAALESQARKAAIPVSVVPDGMGRFPQEAEAAAYFCVLEALQNVSKYAQASRATVHLSQENGDLIFRVTDDGKGFDPATTRQGSGLQNMADRVEALGGSVEVASSPGMGTTVTGRIPVMKQRSDATG